MSKKTKQWPSHSGLISDVSELLSEVKKVVLKGYSIKRNNVWNFVYTGYESGFYEKCFFPTAALRFKENYLTHCNKLNKSLFDVAMELIFHLGIEQGRREERAKLLPRLKTVEKMLERRGKTNDAPNRIEEAETFPLMSSLPIEGLDEPEAN